MHTSVIVAANGLNVFMGLSWGTNRIVLIFAALENLPGNLAGRTAKIKIREKKQTAEPSP
jgi:hypothetical protein